MAQSPLIAFYGDDFTGSAAVMEVLSMAGLSTVLFTETPSKERLAQFPQARAVGIAGDARARSPSWMWEHLPEIFRTLRQTGASIIHYKVCSTFDSSPHLGSIGTAIDIAWDVLDDGRGKLWAPLILGAPQIGRYQAFGNLFAALDGVAYRLDRHPVMQVHPATPMSEADVRLHLAEQTERGVGLVDFLSLKNASATAQLAREFAAGRRIVAVDVIDLESQEDAGALIWRHRGPLCFAVGSQGLEYALTAYWTGEGLLQLAPPRAPAQPVEQIAVMSGSASSVTARQIEWAEAHGFAAHRLDAVACLDPEAWARALDAAIADCLRAIETGKSALVFTARGPDDAAIRTLRERAKALGASHEEVTARLGDGLGQILAALLSRGAVTRGVIAGGDTSGFATRALGVDALGFVAPIAPGAALCIAHRAQGGFELALKGGQMGKQDYFGAVRAGRALED